MCVALKPDWAKGYQRKGLAEFYLKKYEESEQTYKQGLKLEPTNAQLQEGLKRVLEEKKTPNDFQSQMFMKLLQNPKTAGYLKDPAFVQKLQMM
jgi:stress-induced-phosphoprotein 1